MRTPVQLRLTTTESELPALRAEPGSFRDPGGRIYWYGERVLRTVMPSAAEDFDYVESSGLIPQLVERGMLIPQTHVSLELLGDAAGDAAYLLEHPEARFHFSSVRVAVPRRCRLPRCCNSTCISKRSSAA